MESESVLKCRSENQVIVRIWTSGLNKQFPGERTGHVSIEIPGIQISKTNSETHLGEKINFYVSLWPTLSGKNSGLGLFKPIDHEYKINYAADLDEEQREPEITICLYSLNIKQIAGRFAQMKKQIKGWALIGGNKLINQNSAESCSSLAYELLKAGGIYNLVSLAYSSKYSSIVSPDALTEMLFAAKRYELEYYEETVQLIFDKETSLPAKKIFECNIN